MPYKLNHPDSDQEIEREADQLDLYLSSGWETKPGAKPPAEPDSK